MTTTIFLKITKTRFLFSLFFCLLSATQAYAQSAAQTKLIQQAKSDADGQERAASVAAVELEYKSCPKGHYGGPRPHRVRFTRDLWIWVVTPEFAKQYCMPKEFVSEELKGAEAIAFKMYGEPDQSSCGFGGKSEVCDGGSKELRFEIYVKSDTKLPKIRNVPYYMPPTLPSKFLITPSQQNLKESDENHKNGGGMPGTQHIFDGQQVALTGIKDGKSVWFVVTLYNQGFYSNVLGGIDFLSFHGSAGHIKDRRIDAKGIKNFAITFDPLNDKPWSEKPRDLKEYGHVIYLPKTLTDKIRILDAAPGISVEDLGRRALSMPVKK